MQRPGDPIILFFDKPLDPDSVAEGVSLFGPIQEGGLGTIEVGNGLNAEVDGTALILNPEGGLIQGAAYKVLTPASRVSTANLSTFCSETLALLKLMMLVSP